MQKPNLSSPVVRRRLLALGLLAGLPLFWPFYVGALLAGAATALAPQLRRLPARLALPGAFCCVFLGAFGLFWLLAALLTQELPALLLLLPKLQSAGMALLSRTVPALAQSGAAQTQILLPLPFEQRCPTLAEAAPTMLLIALSAVLLQPQLRKLPARMPAVGTRLRKLGLSACRALRQMWMQSGALLLGTLLCALPAARLLGLAFPLLFALLLYGLERLPYIGPGWLLLPLAYGAALTSHSNVCLICAGLYLLLLALRLLLRRQIQTKPAIRHPLGLLIAGYVGYRLSGLIGAVLFCLLVSPLLRLWNRTRQPQHP